MVCHTRILRRCARASKGRGIVIEQEEPLHAVVLPRLSGGIRTHTAAFKSATTWFRSRFQYVTIEPGRGATSTRLRPPQQQQPEPRLYHSNRHSHINNQAVGDLCVRVRAGGQGMVRLHALQAAAPAPTGPSGVSTGYTDWMTTWWGEQGREAHSYFRPLARVEESGGEVVTIRNDCCMHAHSKHTHTHVCAGLLRFGSGSALLLEL